MPLCEKDTWIKIQKQFSAVLLKVKYLALENEILLLRYSALYKDRNADSSGEQIVSQKDKKTPTT